MKNHTRMGRSVYIQTMKKPAYQILVLFSEQLKESTYERHLVSEHYKLNALRRTRSGKSIAVDVDFTQISTGWMKKLTRPTRCFVVDNILEDLKMYNLLWYWPTPKKSQEKQSIKELIDLHIIFRTESVGIYIVNPIKMWRGTIFSAVECTKRLLLENGKPERAMLKDLKPSDEYTLLTQEDQYNLLNDNSITPKLLDL